MQAPLAHALTRCLGPLEITDPDAPDGTPKNRIAEVHPDVRGARSARARDGSSSARTASGTTSPRRRTSRRSSARAAARRRPRASPGASSTMRSPVAVRTTRPRSSTSTVDRVRGAVDPWRPAWRSSSKPSRTSSCRRARRASTRSSPSPPRPGPGSRRPARWSSASSSTSRDRWSVERIEAVRRAVDAAIGMLPESAWFFVVAFDSSAPGRRPGDAGHAGQPHGRDQGDRPAPRRGRHGDVDRPRRRARDLRARAERHPPGGLPHRRQERVRERRQRDRAAPGLRGLLPVRLLGRRHRLAGRRGAADRAGAARQGVAHPRRRRGSRRRSAARSRRRAARR